MLRIELVPSFNALQLHLLYGGALIAVSIALLAFLTSEVTRNYSQIDKLWSIIPPIFAWYFAGASGWQPRLVLMALLATAWGARLTFNFWRRGGYCVATLERRRGLSLGRAARATRSSPVPGAGGSSTSASCRSTRCCCCSSSRCLPSRRPVRQRPLNLLDAGAAVLFIAFLLLETAADQQQYDFQSEKHRRRARR